MLLVRPTGVYPPQRDTWLLADELREVSPGARVLDICTGTGALAVTAALAGGEVTAVDLSRRAVVTARLNAVIHGVRVRARQGDLTGPVADETFDVVVSNPPYVPAETDHLPEHGLDRAYDGGVDGRALLDRICVAAPKVLVPGGQLLLVQSELCGVESTLRNLRGQGMAAEVVAECEHPFGPVLARRAALFESRGLIRAGQRTERLVVVRAVDLASGRATPRIG